MALILGAGLISASPVDAQVVPVVGDVTAVLGLGPYGPGSLDVAATGNIVVDGAGAVLTGAGVPGLAMATPGTVTATVLDVATTGGGSPGLLVDALAGVDLQTDGLVSTTGDDSAAIAITTNGPVTVTSNLLQTAGLASNGVEIVSASGPVNLDASAIDTSGGRSIGALIQAAGDIDADVGVLRTEGSQAAGVQLTTDPAACVVVGAGSCNVAGTLSNVTTGGFLAPGALVRAAGDIGLNVGVLRTEGDQAAGLDLATSPSACAVLGAGSCDTAFAVGDLRTLGLGSTGALVRAAGLTTADIGVLRTDGDDAAGLDIAADPAACAILGSGACDVSAAIDDLTTSGARAAGVLVRAPGDIGVDAGVLRTLGADSAAVDLAADPAACILLGAGACDTFLTADEISTAGDGSAGGLIRAGGPVTASVGRLRTLGLASPGLAIVTDPLVCATLGAAACAVDASVDDGATGGDDADVVDVDNDGPTDVDVDSGSTLGDGASVIDVDGGAGPVAVDVEDGATGGANAPVVEVTTTTGDQTIGVGAVVATGPGSNAIDADSVSGDIVITVREQATSTDAAAIDAATGGTITVNVLPAATVFGDEAAILANAGSGVTINNAGSIGADDGLAIDANGAGAVINNSGAITGRVDLTPGADLFENTGDFVASGTSGFGAGVDVLNNRGRIRVNGPVVFAGLETFNNAGLIDMRDGATDDSLTIPGAFNGQAGSELAVDVNLGAAGTPADRLVVGGAVSGVTTVTLNDIGAGDAVLNPSGVVIVEAGSIAPGAVVIGGGSVGFVDYTLETDTASGDLELVGRPGQSVFDLISVGEVSQNAWHRSSGAVADHADSLRSAAIADPQNARGRSVWGQVFGGAQSRDDLRDIDLFGAPVTQATGYDEHSLGMQFGVDALRQTANGHAYAGVTIGFDRVDADLGVLTQANVDSANIGLYAGWFGERAWVDGVAKVDAFDLELRNADASYAADIDGKSYGAQVQAGYRFGDADLTVEPLVTLAYVRTTIDGFGVGASTVGFDDAESLRGKAGVRVSRQAGDVHPYLAVEAVKEFKGENAMTFGSGGFDARFTDEPADTYGLATVGVERPLPGGGLFVQVQGAFGEVQGLGVRLGLHKLW